MSCGKVHSRRVTSRRAVAKNRHSVPVARRAATPSGKFVVTSKKPIITSGRRSKPTRVVVKKKMKVSQLVKQKHPVAHKAACQAKMRTAAVVKKKTHSRKLQRPFKAPFKQKTPAAVKAQTNLKACKPLSLAVM